MSENPVLDHYFDALADARRREILVTLLGEPRVPVVDVESRVESEGVAIELHHVHLPKLDACDLVDWYPEAGLVTRGAQFADIRPVIEWLDTGGTEHSAVDAPCQDAP